ncbi:MAG TPA: anti-sigma factor [Granulicella sp.]
MAAGRRHLTDEDLLQFLDGECAAGEAERVREHLDACVECRARRQDFERAGAIFDEIQSAVQREARQPGLETRSVLRERLAADAPAPRKGLFSWATYRYAAVVAAVLLLGILAGRSRLFVLEPHATDEARLRPDSGLTPGATRMIDLNEICAESDDDLDPAVSSETKEKVLQEYGLNEKASGEYQVDYLINPQLGGTSDVRNLWPEPYRSRVWNARAKDALETRLHSMVCEGQIDLASAQREIATDWIAAYKKYLHRDHPV